MTTYRYTAAAEDFVATADSRETSREIMRAIAGFAKDTAEAVTIWEEGLTNWDDESKLAFIHTVTSDGLDAADSFVWGAAGSQWAGADYDQSPLQESDGILNADLAEGLDLDTEEDRALYRTRVAKRYENMRKHALVKEATDYGQGAYAHLSHRELVRKIADRSINYLLADV